MVAVSPSTPVGRPSPLPAGLGVLDAVVVPRTAGPRVAFHRPSALAQVTGCGRELVELCEVLAALAVGLGCRPCTDCWPPAVVRARRPRLRPAAPLPASAASHSPTVPSRKEPAMALTGLLSRIRPRRRHLAPAGVLSEAQVNRPYVPQRLDMKALNRNHVATGRRGSARTAVGL